MSTIACAACSCVLRPPTRACHKACNVLRSSALDAFIVFMVGYNWPFAAERHLRHLRADTLGAKRCVYSRSCHASFLLLMH